MKVEELRIGNLIWRPCCNDKVVEIRDNGIIGLDRSRGIILLSEIKPIPITEDILLSYGFEKEHNGEYVTIYTKKDCIEILCQKNVYYPYDSYSDVCLGRELKYVHELQNAIFILKGNELIY